MPKKTKEAKRLKIAALRREVKYSKYTLSRAEKEWKKLCTKITLPKLREELIFSWHSFEKVIDMKDFIISLYMDEVRNHEETYMINCRNQLDNIQRLMEGFSRKLHDIHQENNEQLKNLIRKSLGDWVKQTAASESAENYIKVMSFALEIKRKHNEKHTKTENFAKVNEETSKNIQDIQQLTFILELKLEETWDHIMKSQDDYFQHTRENKKRHDAIKEVDDANNRTVRREFKKLVHLQELVKRLTMKFKDLGGTIGRKVEYLESEKESLHECFFAFKNKLQQDRDVDMIKRTLMTVEFVKSFEHLEKIMKKGEKIMKILKVSHKYETFDEKILPYPDEGDLETDLESLPQLRLFWQRLANVQATRYALNEERIYLKKQNKILKQEIHKHCQCLDCPVLPPIPSRVGKVPYTEGAAMIQKQKLQKGSKEKLVRSENAGENNGSSTDGNAKNGINQNGNDRNEINSLRSS